MEDEEEPQCHFCMGLLMKLKKEAEGTGEKIAGEVQEKIGQIKKVFGT